MLKTLCGLLLLISPALADETLDDINFPLNSSMVVDEFHGLDLLAAVMAKHDSLDLEVIGHTDSLGSAPYNKRLSEKRAERVKAYLISKGAPEARIKTSGDGISDKFDNSTREGRFQNRRVSLTLYETHNGSRSAVTWPRLMELFFGDSPRVKELEQEIAEAKTNNDALMKKISEITAALEKANKDLQDKLAAMETRQAKMTEEMVAKMEQAVASAKVGQYGSVSIGGGTDDDGDFAARARGQYFRQLDDNFAIQGQAEFNYWDGFDDGQLDAAFIFQKERWKLAAAASYKWAAIDGFETARMGQGAIIGEYRFDTGKIGAFGTVPFADGDVIGETIVGIYTIETYVNVVEQIGLDFGVALGDKMDLSGYISSLDTEVADVDLGAALRLDVSINDLATWYIEAEQNASLLGDDDTTRFLTGVRLGSWNKARYNVSDTITPVNIPTIKYELLQRMTRTGNNPPVAIAGESRNNVAAGEITLDGSASFDPDGDAITYRWVQTAGNPVVLSGADSAVATFTGVAGESYVFQLTVRDSMGDSSSDLISIGMEAAPAPPANVLNFIATPNTITVGELTTLSWATDGAVSVTISGIGEVGTSGNIPVSPDVTTTYTLTATNADGQSNTAETTVTVNAVVIPDAAISFFRALPDTIEEGGTSTLSWATVNGDTVEISGIGQVNAEGSLSVAPNETTTYTLTVTNGAGSVTQDVTVTVNPRPAASVSFFTAIPDTIILGENTTLSWSTQNADSVVLEGFGQVNAEGSLILSPRTTTTYTLVASNDKGSQTASVTVTVNPVPPANQLPIADAGVDQFIRTGTLVTLNGANSFDPEGSTLTYSWTQVFGPAVSLSDASSATPSFTAGAQGARYVFRLTVTDEAGNTDTDEVTVGVITFGAQ